MTAAVLDPVADEPQVVDAPPPPQAFEPGWHGMFAPFPTVTVDLGALRINLRHVSASGRGNDWSQLLDLDAMIRGPVRSAAAEAVQESEALANLRRLTAELRAEERAAERHRLRLAELEAKRAGVVLDGKAGMAREVARLDEQIATARADQEAAERAVAAMQRPVREAKRAVEVELERAANAAAGGVLGRLMTREQELVAAIIGKCSGELDALVQTHFALRSFVGVSLGKALADSLADELAAVPVK